MRLQISSGYYLEHNTHLNVLPIYSILQYPKTKAYHFLTRYLVTW